MEPCSPHFPRVLSRYEKTDGPERRRKRISPLTSMAICSGDMDKERDGWIFVGLNQRAILVTPPFTRRGVRGETVPDWDPGQLRSDSTPNTRLRGRE